MKYLLMLLYIGLMWGQDYDPESGEIVLKSYNPNTGQKISIGTDSQGNPQYLSSVASDVMRQNILNMIVKKTKTLHSTMMTK